MTWFADLSPYTYWDLADPDHRRQEPWPGLPVRNVGWLAAGHPFPVGPVDADLVAALTRLARRSVHQTRGRHFCEFCLAELERDHQREATALDPVPYGSAEFRVLGAGVSYALPTLAVHYVAAHGYQPPAEVRAAALAAVPR
jgi:hypothetical protein